MPPEIQDSPDDSNVLVECVVDGVGEALRQQTVIAEDLRVDACIQHEGVDVGKQGVKEVLAQPLALHLVE